MKNKNLSFQPQGVILVGLTALTESFELKG